jgi:hypothetical protein
VLGGGLRWQQSFSDRATLRLGSEVRADLIGMVGLYRSTAALIREPVREDRVDQASLALWGEVEARLTPRLRAVAGLRADAMG